MVNCCRVCGGPLDTPSTTLCKGCLEMMGFTLESLQEPEEPVQSFDDYLYERLKAEHE